MLWYMSFADKSGWLGAIITESPSMLEAVQKCWDLNINPGGGILGRTIEVGVPSEYRDRLLTRKECETVFGKMESLREMLSRQEEV